MWQHVCETRAKARHVMRVSVTQELAISPWRLIKTLFLRQMMNSWWVFFSRSSTKKFKLIFHFGKHSRARSLATQLLEAKEPKMSLIINAGHEGISEFESTAVSRVLKWDFDVSRNERFGCQCAWTQENCGQEIFESFQNDVERNNGLFTNCLTEHAAQTKSVPLLHFVRSNNGHSSIYICRMHRPTQNNASSVASTHRHTGIPDASLFPLEHKTILNWWKQACITRDVNDLCGLILDVRRNVNNLRSMVSPFEWLVNEWRTIFVM